MSEYLKFWKSSANIRTSEYPSQHHSFDLTAVQVSNPPLPAHCCYHKGCPESYPVVYTLIQCAPVLAEKADVAPDVTLRFTVQKQVSVLVREPPCL